MLTAESQSRKEQENLILSASLRLCGETVLVNKGGQKEPLGLQTGINGSISISKIQIKDWNPPKTRGNCSAIPFHRSVIPLRFWATALGGGAALASD